MVCLLFVEGSDQEVKRIVRCHGLGWDSVNFLHRGLHDAVFWIFDENSVDNTRMF